MEIEEPSHAYKKRLFTIQELPLEEIYEDCKL
jgi:hypothetical protein